MSTKNGNPMIRKTVNGCTYADTQHSRCAFKCSKQKEWNSIYIKILSIRKHNEWSSARKIFDENLLRNFYFPFHLFVLFFLFSFLYMYIVYCILNFSVFSFYPVFFDVHIMVSCAFAASNFKNVFFMM